VTLTPKSEPGNSEDLRCFVEREVERLRKSWLEGIAKVVEAPVGSRIAILPPANEPTGAAGSMPLRLTDDPAAPAYLALPLDETHPHRAMEVASEVNRRLRRKKLGTHHIVWIRRVFEIQKNIVFCYTQKHVSPRYSEAFVDWIVEQLEANEKFLGDCKVRYDELKGKT